MQDEIKNKAFLRLVSLKKNTRKTPILLGICIGLGIAAGILLGVADESFLGENTEFSTIGFFGAVVLAQILSVILHEMGHLIFGLLSGYRFVSFRVFIFALYKKEGRLKFGMYAVPGTAGQCLMVPPEGKGEIPYKLMNLGGVLVNAVEALLFLPLGVITFHSVPFFVMVLFFSLGAMGLVMAITNGIPMKTRMVTNDGYNIKQLSRDKEGRRAYANQLRMTEAMHRGMRLREMDEAWFKTADGANDNRMVSSIRSMAAERLLDQGNFAAAEEALFALVANESSLTDGEVYGAMTELLYLEMVGEHRREVVEAYRGALADFFKMSQNNLSVLRVQAVYHLLFTGNLAEANKNKMNFEKFIKAQKRFPFSGTVDTERMLFAYGEAIYNDWLKKRA